VRIVREDPAEDNRGKCEWEETTRSSRRRPLLFSSFLQLTLFATAVAAFSGNCGNLRIFLCHRLELQICPIRSRRNSLSVSHDFLDGRTTKQKEEQEDRAKSSLNSTGLCIRSDFMEFLMN
jgi:hypothetical protein